MGTRVYLGRISYNVREKDVERFFRGYGRLRDIIIKNGYGFVDFEDYRDADDAVYELSGKDLCGERVRLELARGSSRAGSSGGRGGSFRRRPNWLDKYGPPTRTEFRVLVENLSSRVSWQDLKDYMRQAGEVTYADAHRPNKNEGYVEFSCYSDMKKALDKLDGTEINGRRIKITEDRPKKRSRSRSRGRRSRSRSRSRSRRRSHSRSRSRSSSKSRSRSRSRDRSKSRSPSRSRTPERKRSNSRNYSRDDSDDD